MLTKIEQHLKVTRSEESWPEHRENVEIANISISTLRVVVLSVFTQQKYFFTSNFSSSRRVHAGSLFTSEKLYQ